MERADAPVPSPAPAGRPPAPGPLAIVQQFVNTRDVEQGTDDIGAPAQLAAWLRARGLLASMEPIDDAGVRRALEVREALRSMLLANNGLEPDPGFVDRLNEASAAAGFSLVFTPDATWQLRARAPGVDGAIGTLLGVASEAMADGSWDRLKVCYEDTCRWAFFDQSKNQSGKWCAMKVCGNRSKSRNWRRRNQRSEP